MEPPKMDTTAMHTTAMDTTTRLRRLSIRAALTLVVLAIVAMWAWIYLFAPRDNPDRLESRPFAAAAEAACLPLQSEINALPTGRDADTVAERTKQIIAGTELTETMVTALRGAVDAHVTDSHDLLILEAWFADWDAYLQDRWRHVSKLQSLGESAEGSDLRFILTERAEGGIYTRRIDGLANVNDMESCHTPLDL
ncbi:MAG: hypothetical protein OXB92_08810 [Acidimicrobiaceae bacterium]|nr:hypothetical protein [Acidimicrobiia bacterium]MCY4493940.1 hypothetical protein [Acidimicrobiaceae bacterium]